MWESFAFDAAFVFGTGRMSAVGKKSGSVFSWQNLTKIRKWRSGLRSFAKKTGKPSLRKASLIYLCFLCLFLSLQILLGCGKHQLDTVQLVYLAGTWIIVNCGDIRFWI